MNRRTFSRLLVLALAGIAAAIATTAAQSSGGKWWSGIRQRPGQLALFRVATDQQIQRHPAPGRVDLSVRRHRAAIPSSRRA